MKITPMLQQYLNAKEAHPGSIVFFRMGDFYEVFLEDAELVAGLLELTLTTRSKQDEAPIPMAGVPYHAATQYVRRLVQMGYSVAICEQLEDPSKAKGIVRRGVVRVVTPGMYLDDDDPTNAPRPVVAVSGDAARGFALASLVYATGELVVMELVGLATLRAELVRMQPAEAILPEAVALSLRADLPGHVRTYDPAGDPANALDALLRGVDVRQMAIDHSSMQAVHLTPAAFRDRWKAIASQHVRDLASVERAASRLLRYVMETQGGIPLTISAPQVLRVEGFVRLDPATVANLEIFETLRGAVRKGSLLATVDRSVTPAGGRLLRSWLAYPLAQPARILHRQRFVGTMVRQASLRSELRAGLAQIADMERLCTRLATGQCSARDLVALGASLRRIPALRQALSDLGGLAGALGADLLERLDPCATCAEDIGQTLVDEPPPTLHDGGLIREGVSELLDQLVTLAADGKDWLLRYEAQERKETGIASLKVRYNRVFGYYIEVTRAHMSAVPERYLRKQTLANAERYYTAEIKEYEEKILHAEERRAALEAELFEALRLRVLDHVETIRQSAGALAELDVLVALAERAAEGGWVAPEITEECVLDIEEGRHPVVEASLRDKRFVPNSLFVDRSTRTLLLTGPNMAGKSTVIRQAALVALLAQVGSWVPAARARLGVFDQIFSRVGASDNLAKGQSTFMVEMSETAHILTHATQRSLVILDEIGRGTATWDGMAIARAVVEHLHDEIGCLSLFATHYHELTELGRIMEGIKNQSVAVKEWGGEIIFLHKLVDGAASRSYGVEVASLAGVPRAVVDRAREHLAELEERSLRRETPSQRSASGRIEPSPQLSLFAYDPNVEALRALVRALAAVPVEATTPLRALLLLEELGEEARKLMPPA